MRSSVIAVAAMVFLTPVLTALTVGAESAPQPLKQRSGAVQVEVDLPALPKAQRVRLWLPYPMSDRNQDITDVKFEGNHASSAVYRTPLSDYAVLYAEWNGPADRRTITLSFQVRRKEVRAGDLPREMISPRGQEFEPFLSPTSRGPTGGRVKEIADSIAAGKTPTLEKSRAVFDYNKAQNVYDYVVENMSRDPEVKACGVGDVEITLARRSGKCADITSVFVALLRASGVPAREVFGLRLPAGRTGDMTKAQHCWAEFHLPGYGWVVADPADVLKDILDRKITIEEAKFTRDFFFGGMDENRIAFGSGRDVVLTPPQDGPPLNYFMYPYAEADGVTLNEDIYGQNLGYKITFAQGR